MSEPTFFRQYLISKTRQGAPVELMRSVNEVVCLAYDTKLRRLVNLHALIDPVSDHASFQMRTKALHASQHPGLSWFLQAGEDEGAWYYITAHADGERLHRYLERLEQIPAYLAASIVASIAEAYLALAQVPHLIPPPSLDQFTLEAGAAESRTLLTHFQMKEQVTPFLGKPPSAGQVTKRVRALLGMVAQKTGPNWYKVESQISCVTFRDQLELVLSSPNVHLFTPFREVLPWLIEASEGADSFQELPELYRPHTFLATQLDGIGLIQNSFRDQFIPDTTHTQNTQGYEFPGSSDLGDDRLLLQVLPSRPICGEEPRQEVRRALLRHTSAEHPHLLRVVSFVDAVSSSLFLEEKPAGPTLNLWKADRDSVTPEDAWSILDGITHALKEAELLGMKPFGLDPEDIFLNPAPHNPAQPSPWLIVWRAHPCVRKLIRRPVADSVEYPALDFTWLACWLFDFQPDTPPEGPAVQPEIRELLSLIWQKALQGEPLPPHEVTARLKQASHPSLSLPSARSKPPTRPLPLDTLTVAPSPPTHRPSVPVAEPAPGSLSTPRHIPATAHEPEPVSPFSTGFKQTDQQVAPTSPPPPFVGTPIHSSATDLNDDDDDPIAFAALTQPSYSKSNELTPSHQEPSHGLAEVLFPDTRRGGSHSPSQTPRSEPAATQNWMRSHGEDNDPAHSVSAYLENSRNDMPFLFKILLLLAASALLATFLRNARQSSPNAPISTPTTTAPQPAAFPPAPPIAPDPIDSGVRDILDSAPPVLPPVSAQPVLPPTTLPAPSVAPPDAALSNPNNLDAIDPPPVIPVEETTLPLPNPLPTPATSSPTSEPDPPAIPEMRDPIPQAIPVEEDPLPPIPRAIVPRDPTPPSEPPSIPLPPAPRAIPVEE